MSLAVNRTLALSRCIQASTFRITSGIAVKTSSQVSPTLHRAARRKFCSAPRFCLRSSELTPKLYTSLRANGDRLWQDIHSTAQIGIGERYGEEPEQTGVSRLTLTEDDDKARQWFLDTTNSLGCEVTTDNIGNMFAIRPGLNNDVPATFVGSHLDTQPTGGRFDGVLGVCAGIEMLRTLNDNWIETEGPVGVVNWTNEEGARFPCSMMGSGVWAGAVDYETILNLKEVGDGKLTVRDELRRMNLLDQRKSCVKDSGVPMAGHFELHIEQGPVLETSKRAVAAVSGVQAYEWFEVTVKGSASHAGTTPLDSRQDPVMFAALLISQARKVARKAKGLVTCGRIEAFPGSINTIPDQVRLTLDIRHESEAELSQMIQKIQSFEPQFGKVTYKSIFKSPATKLDPMALHMVSRGISSIEHEPFKMISGAGHDSVNTSKHCPTAMVFVPCRNGISHHPSEWATKADCVIGTNVIIQSILRFDHSRQKDDFIAAATHMGVALTSSVDGFMAPL